MGMAHSTAAAGTAAFGTPWPCEKAFVSSVSRQLRQRCMARRTRTSLNGSWSSLNEL